MMTSLKDDELKAAFKVGEEYMETMRALNPNFCKTIEVLMTAAGWEKKKK